jgi:hypothetical protein
VLEDVYKPHTHAEIAARLDEAKSYGIFWFSRRRTTRKRVSAVGANGREYKWRYTVKDNSREQWVAIPVPHSGIPRELVDAARAMVKDNRAPAKTGRRFWQIPSAAVRCKDCGKIILKYSAGVGD